MIRKLAPIVSVGFVLFLALTGPASWGCGEGSCPERAGDRNLGDGWVLVVHTHSGDDLGSWCGGTPGGCCCCSATVDRGCCDTQTSKTSKQSCACGCSPDRGAGTVPVPYSGGSSSRNLEQELAKVGNPARPVAGSPTVVCDLVLRDFMAVPATGPTPIYLQLNSILC